MKRQILMLILLWTAGCSWAQTNSVEQAELPNEEDKIAKLLQVGNDPFRMSGAGAAEPVSGQNAAHISGGIQIQGILCLEGKAPCALIKIRDTAPQLVRKDDVLLLPADGKKQSAAQPQTANPNYLLITEITGDCIKVAPRQRPQEQITIR